MCIRDSYLNLKYRYHSKPYVEILKADGDFAIKNVEIGISDGINVEIIEGVILSDKIKVWNKTEPIKIGEEGDSAKK